MSLSFVDSRMFCLSATSWGFWPLCYCRGHVVIHRFFAVSMGPLAWVLITEVFPMKVRGVGSSIGSLSNWLFNSIVVWTFFKVIKGFTSLFGSEDMGTAGAFCSFALVAAIGLVWGISFYLRPRV